MYGHYRPTEGFHIPFGDDPNLKVKKLQCVGLHIVNSDRSKTAKTRSSAAAKRPRDAYDTLYERQTDGQKAVAIRRHYMQYALRVKRAETEGTNEKSRWPTTICCRRSPNTGVLFV